MSCCVAVVGVVCLLRFSVLRWCCVSFLCSSCCCVVVVLFCVLVLLCCSVGGRMLLLCYVVGLRRVPCHVLFCCYVVRLLGRFF